MDVMVIMDKMVEVEEVPLLMVVLVTTAVVEVELVYMVKDLMV